MIVGGYENFTVQFPDLTEINWMRDSWKAGVVTPKHLAEIKTEFIFFVRAVGVSQNAMELGFKPVSAMNNWYYAHKCEARRMLFYWMRNPNPQVEEQKPYRCSWGINRYYDNHLPPHVPNRENPSQDTFLAASGCGFMIGEPPFEKKWFHRFHTLMRMPVAVPRPQAKELVQHGFRLLDTGKLASYWINGWALDQYSYQKECEYFNCNEDWTPKEVKPVKLVDGNKLCL
jgi:hypothetical protein